MNSEIEQYVEENIIPQYKLFDKAHNVDHVRTVIKESIELSEKLNAEKENAYIIAAYHDLGLSKDREKHHITSGQILLNDNNLKLWFSKEDIILMKEAVEDHRASIEHEPRSIYGRIVAEADRVIDTKATIKRTLQFAMKHHPQMDKEFYYKEVVDHLNTKFSEGGYIKLWFENSKNAIKLKELRLLIKDKTKLRAVFENIYKEETVKL